MATKTNPTTVGDQGEQIVAAELRRRGYRVVRLGMAHDYDLTAEKNGRKLNIQVKTIKAGDFQLVATKFIKIDIVDGVQSVRGRQILHDAKSIWIFASIKGKNTFYLMRKFDVQDIILRDYKANLKKHKGKRPRNPYSFHTAISLSSLHPWKAHWGILDN